MSKVNMMASTSTTLSSSSSSSTPSSSLSCTSEPSPLSSTAAAAAAAVQANNNYHHVKDKEEEEELLLWSSSLLSQLERLPQDVSALVLSHLTVQELVHSLSLTSKTMCRACRSSTLWQMKFQARWPNFHCYDGIVDQQQQPFEKDNNDLSSSSSWYSSYQRAYRHPHDLWITHWNCVYPNDGLSPGRCCIPPPTTTTTTALLQKKQHCKSNNNNTNSNKPNSSSSYCPSCRYNPLTTSVDPNMNLIRNAWQQEFLYQRQVRRQKQPFQKQQHDLHGDDDINNDIVVGTMDDPILIVKRQMLCRHDAVASTTTCTITTTPAQRMAMTTQYYLAKACRRLFQEFYHQNHTTTTTTTTTTTDDDDMESPLLLQLQQQQILLESLNSPCDYFTARQAFEKAATFHRTIVHEQYRTDQLCFLQDVLFFNVATSTTLLSSSSSSSTTTTSHEKEQQQPSAITSSSSSAAAVGGSSHDNDQDEIMHLQRDVHGNCCSCSSIRNPGGSAVAGQPTTTSAASMGFVSATARSSKSSSSLEDDDDDSIIDNGHDDDDDESTNDDENDNDESIDDEDDNDESIDDDDDDDDNINHNPPPPPVAEGTNRRPPGAATTTTVIKNVPLEYEMARHSWHVIQLSNPDRCRPIIFRIMVQRPDCFAVFPTQGYLCPGASCSVTLSVRPMGSLLCEAFHAIQVHREGVDIDPDGSGLNDLANVYTEEAHLPYAPFCVRYMYAPTTPCVPPNYYRHHHHHHYSFDPTNLQPIPQQPQRHSTNNNNNMSNSTRGSNNHNRDDTQQQHSYMMDHLWDHVATEADIRTIYLSAHVVPHHYSFLDFQRSTLCPFTIRQQVHGPCPYTPNSNYNNHCHDPQQHQQQQHHGCCGSDDEQPLVFVAPELQVKDSTVFHLLHNMRWEVEDSTYAELSYRTEAACYSCGQKWGLRCEELGHAHAIARMECLAHAMKRIRSIQNITVCVRQLQETINVLLTEQDETVPDEKELSMDGVMERMFQLLYMVHTVLQYHKTFPLISSEQLQFLLEMEWTVDDMCVRLNQNLCHFKQQRRDRPRVVADNVDNDEDDNDGRCNLDLWIPWRNAGVYPYLTCTDSIFNPSSSLLPLMGITTKASTTTKKWRIKEEPNYLEAFRHLAHGPGRFCLGPREDPNHLGETLCAEQKSRYYRRQTGGLVTDMFMDDPVRALECAVCMLYDPKSLLVHGIYDRVLAGGVSRRPKFPLDVLSFLDEDETDDEGVDIRNHGSGQAIGECTSWNEVVARRTSYYELQDAFDLHSIGISGAESALSISVKRYLRNIPPPGRGKFVLCNENHHETLESGHVVDIVPWDLQDSFIGVDFASVANTTTQESLQPQHPENRRVANVPAVHVDDGPRVHNLLGVLSAHLGWRTVDEGHGAGLVFVDRRILIATQMVSISLLIGPILGSLFGRCARWIPTKPIAYHLEDMPFSLDNEMRFLTEKECGYVAALLVLAWLILVRRTERMTGRDFFRIMLEHISTDPRNQPKPSFFARIGSQIVQWCHRQWDATCPLFLQRLVFTPKWNRRSQSDLIDHIASWRSKDLREHRNEFKAAAVCGKMVYDQIAIHDASESFVCKVIVSCIVASGSFCASSPHFLLNLLTVFCCSIGLGLSISLHSMELGRSPFRSQHSGSILRRHSLVTIIMFSFLVGQLVGSSGGVLFLAEFVVTSMSFLLGGAGTISGSALESWGCFFCLSSAAFWGYLCARVALMDGILHKRGGFSSALLCTSILVAVGLLIVTFWFWKWETAPALMIVLPRLAGTDRKVHRMARSLQ